MLYKLYSEDIFTYLNWLTLFITCSVTYTFHQFPLWKYITHTYLPSVTKGCMMSFVNVPLLKKLGKNILGSTSCKKRFLERKKNHAFVLILFSPKTCGPKWNNNIRFLIEHNTESSNKITFVKQQNLSTTNFPC